MTVQLLGLSRLSRKTMTRPASRMCKLCCAHYVQSDTEITIGATYNNFNLIIIYLML